MALPTDRTANSSIADHVSDHNTLHEHYNNPGHSAYSVKDYGAVGDAVTDDTAAIQAAFDAADTAASGLDTGPVVYFPPGTYSVDSTLTWKEHSIQGDGPFTARIQWDAAGGTCMERSDFTVWMRGMRFRPGSGKPDIWLDMDADSATDYGDWLDDCFFEDWNDTTGVAAIRTGGIINTHWRNLRFGGGKGFAIIVKSGGGGSFTLDNFTIDTASAGSGVFQALVNVHQTGAGTCVVRVANGRMENTAQPWSDPSAVVWVDSDPANNLGIVPAAIRLESLEIDIGGAQDVALVHQDTTQDSIGSSVFITNTQFAGSDTTRFIGSGNWSSAVELPNKQSGVLGFMAVGRFNSGAAQDQRTNWFIQSLVLGDNLSMKEGVGDPGTEGVEFARIYIPADLDPNVQFSDGTIKELIPKSTESAGSPTLDWSQSIINIESTGGARTVTLPDNAAFDGKNYLIRRDGSNTVTIDRAGSDTFDDADVQKTLDTDSASIHIFSIGDGEWKIITTDGTVNGS